MTGRNAPNRTCTLLLPLAAACCLIPLAGALGCVVNEAGPARSAGPESYAFQRPFEIMVVGTIHKFHLVQKDYPVAVLGSLIHGYKPNLILVEIRPHALTRGHYEDGPFEMAAVVAEAQKSRIPVEGIDWWRESEIGADPKIKPEAAMALRREIEPLMPLLPFPPSFARLHSPAYLRGMLQIINARTRLMDGNPMWNRRQAWMHHRAAEAIRTRPGSRVLAFVGAQHQPELLAFLSQLGGKASNPAELFAQAGHTTQGLSTRPASDQAVSYWRRGIQRMRAKAGACQGALRKSYLQKIRYFEVAVERKGLCCVPMESLRASEQAEPEVKQPRPVAPPTGPSTVPAPTDARDPSAAPRPKTGTGTSFDKGAPAKGPASDKPASDKPASDKPASR